MKVIEIDHDAFESFVSKKIDHKQATHEKITSAVARNSMKTIATYP